MRIATGMSLLPSPLMACLPLWISLHILKTRSYSSTSNSNLIQFALPSISVISFSVRNMARISFNILTDEAPHEQSPVEAPLRQITETPLRSPHTFSQAGHTATPHWVTFTRCGGTYLCPAHNKRTALSSVIQEGRETGRK